MSGRSLEDTVTRSVAWRDQVRGPPVSGLAAEISWASVPSLRIPDAATDGFLWPDDGLPEPRPLSPATTPGPDAVTPVRHPRALPAGSLIPAHYRNCFGCGPDHGCGLHLTTTVGPDLEIRAEVALTADHQGAAGLAHGGLLAAIADEAMGSLHWLLLVPAVTARLEVDYVAPVLIGSQLILRARITGQDGRKVYGAAVIAVNGRVVLRASGLFVQVPTSHFRGFDSTQDADLDLLEPNP